VRAAVNGAVVVVAETDSVVDDDEDQTRCPAATNLHGAVRS